MGCHTWVYKHLPERQEELKEKILSQTIDLTKDAIQQYNDGDYLNEAFIHFIDEAVYGMMHDPSPLHKMFYNDVLMNWSSENYKQYVQEDLKCELEDLESGLLPIDGVFYDDKDNKHHCYYLIQDKVYIDCVTPYEDFVRIDDYDHDCYTVEEVEAILKKNGVDYPTRLLEEMFKEDIFIRFS